MTRKKPNRNGLLKGVVCAVAALTVANFTAAGTAVVNPPNIVLVLTDDQGWTDTSVQMLAAEPASKSDFYRTPALQRMAGEGMVFSNAYSPAPTCTPSRGSIQFGKTPARLRQTVVHDVLARSRGIDCRSEISLPQMIKSADPRYVTAHFGKWGFPPRRPEHAGYDVSDGNTNNGDGDWDCVKLRTPLPPDDPKRIFSLTRRANVFMEAQVKAERPFFMQLSHYALHVQHDALEETAKRYGKLLRVKQSAPSDYGRRPASQNTSMPRFAAMIENLDTGLGMLLDKVQELGIKDNTYGPFGKKCPMG